MMGSRPSLTGPLLAALVALAAPGAMALGSGDEPSPSSFPADPVYVDSATISYVESCPVQAMLVVRGSLPTPCHEAVWAVDDDPGASVDVRLWSEADPQRICIQVLHPFEVSIPLGTCDTPDVPVLLNGEEVGRLQPPESSAMPVSLQGAGWSFGMCQGTCSADLVIDGSALVLTGRDRTVEEPVFENRGTLTPAGQQLLSETMSAVQGVPLQPVYGCPDCADGGAAYLALLRDGVSSRHEMEYGNPPEQLAGAYELTVSVMEALETCQSNVLVVVAEDCRSQAR